EDLVALYLGGADRDKLDPILDTCVAVYTTDLDEDGQVDFKGKAKAFTRTYGCLAAILPYSNADWEKLSISLNFLTPKLPAPEEQGLSKGTLLAKTSLPRIRFHDLRHSHATQLLSAGVHPKIASERLGHSTVGITLDLYSHVMPGKQENAAEQVDAAIKAAKKASEK